MPQLKSAINIDVGYIVATVLRVEEEALILQSIEQGQLQAVKAHSLWFEIKAGDTVVVMQFAQKAWVTELLETSDGRVLSVKQNEIYFHAKHFSVQADETSWFGKSFTLKVLSFKSIVQTSIMRCLNSFRFIQSHDHHECHSQTTEAQSMIKRKAELAMDDTEQSAITTKKLLINTD